MILMTLLFLLLMTGIAWIVAESDVSWKVKLAFITAAVYLSLSIGMSIENFKGWATESSLPENFVINWIVIEEPMNIYLWVTPAEFEAQCEPLLICFSEAELGEPRAYRIPYTPEDHAKMEMILGMLMMGEPVVGEASGGGDKEPNPYGIITEHFEAKRMPKLRERLQKKK